MAIEAIVVHATIKKTQDKVSLNNDEKIINHSILTNWFAAINSANKEKVKQRETTRKRKATLNILKAKPLPPKKRRRKSHTLSHMVCSCVPVETYWLLILLVCLPSVFQGRVKFWFLYLGKKKLLNEGKKAKKKTHIPRTLHTLTLTILWF